MPVMSIASKYSISTSTDIDAVIRKIDSENEPKESNEHMQIKTSRDLLEESSNIGDLKRYNMLLQNISLSPNVKNYLNKNRK